MKLNINIQIISGLTIKPKKSIYEDKRLEIIEIKGEDDNGR